MNLEKTVCKQRLDNKMEISAEIPDWSREHKTKYWLPGIRLLKTIRSYQFWQNKKSLFRYPVMKFAVLRHKFWSVVASADIPVNTRIGGGLLMNHPNGIVIHPAAVIGVNCLLNQQVTLGTGGKYPGVPTLGGHVDVGAGAKILGGIHIGNHARIGANAVVLENVPDNCTAVGVPARIVTQKPKGLV